MEELDPGSFKEYIDKDHEIARIIARAEAHEKDSMRLAIKNYKQAVKEIIKFDEQGNTAMSWRQSRIPVNRLSSVYEKEGKYKEALALINWYQDYDDYLGLTKYGNEMIEKRKKRIEKKMK